MIKKLFSLALILSLIFSFAACSFDEQKTAVISENVQKLSFKQAASYEGLKELDGQTVSIDGYLATSSPADGSFIFLMNLPYQSCPFCKPNTSELANTLECYPKKGEAFDYTNQAVRVTGTLEVAKSKEEPFTDKYGYEFNFKITDAEYKIIKSEDLSEQMQVWQKLAQSDALTDVNKMFNYVSFLVSWPTYYVNNYTDDNGQSHKGYYFYASDAIKILETEDSQYSYGNKDGYFDLIVEKIEAVDKDAFADLVQSILQCKALAQRAKDDLYNGEYTYEEQYVEMFDNTDYVYTLNNGNEMCDEFNNIYEEYSLWLSQWEL